ncbi:phytanoyl-CoA dioxygenase family protein [Spectribacter hydrogenooxidans]|uniref:Phytanoyl-CoA dioxygenase family protein n=1 Tax=Spectribacter hydrogenoxidans TaxID=3075608 RepID=A0ABU3C2Q0_9GAMM|nr:phytanoyl-CoA dioxygenase family protein [Salinisphaera sp. W335]MDT0635812.1 phytanoyl-CoA dioxygenase family protein [Salinisphaera sp. W335]
MSALIADTRSIDHHRAEFARDGYTIVRGMADAGRLQRLRDLVGEHLTRAVAPVEYEADVAYPGAPAGRDAPGGQTVRRLLQAFDRDAHLADWALVPAATAMVGALLDSRDLRLTRCHHNCVMTKQPAYSSATGWHQDLRYWSFERPELVNAWLALGHEHPANGGMRLLPGTHRMSFAADQLDEARFLREDRADNLALLASARTAELAPGDVLFFHAGVFHAAGRNTTDERKLSAVFTYHDAGNPPVAGSRSARLPGVSIRPGYA